MRIVYSNEKVKIQCSDYEETRKVFGGNRDLTDSFYEKFYYLQGARSLKEIYLIPRFRLHKLRNVGRSRLQGYFAIDVKTHKEPWRIILQPLDDNMHPLSHCDADRTAAFVKIIEIKEISKHYE